MTPQEFDSKLALALALVQFGVATVQQIKTAFTGMGATNAQLNAVLAALEADAARRQAISDAIANG